MHLKATFPRTNHSITNFLPTGLVFLSENRLAVVDYNNKRCFLTNTHLEEIGRACDLDKNPNSVCEAPGDRLAVTTGKYQCVYILHIGKENQITVEKRLDVETRYKSISLFTAEPGDPENISFLASTYKWRSPMRVVSIAGKEKDLTEAVLPKKIYQFRDSCSTYVREDTTLVFTDRFEHKVFIFDLERKSKTLLVDDRLDEPRGSCAGPNKSFLVCNNKTNSIIHIASSGQIIDEHRVNISPRAITMSKDCKMVAISFDMETARLVEIYDIEENSA